MATRRSSPSPYDSERGGLRALTDDLRRPLNGGHQPPMPQVPFISSEQRRQDVEAIAAAWAGCKTIDQLMARHPEIIDILAHYDVYTTEMAREPLRNPWQHHLEEGGRRKVGRMATRLALTLRGIKMFSHQSPGVVMARVASLPVSMHAEGLHVRGKGRRGGRRRTIAAESVTYGVPTEDADFVSTALQAVMRSARSRRISTTTVGDRRGRHTAVTLHNADEYKNRVPRRVAWELVLRDIRRSIPNFNLRDVGPLSHSRETYRPEIRMWCEELDVAYGRLALSATWYRNGVKRAVIYDDIRRDPGLLGQEVGTLFQGTADLMAGLVQEERGSKPNRLQATTRADRLDLEGGDSLSRSSHVNLGKQDWPGPTRGLDIREAFMDFLDSKSDEFDGDEVNTIWRLATSIPRGLLSGVVAAAKFLNRITDGAHLPQDVVTWVWRHFKARRDRTIDDLITRLRAA